MVGALTLLVLAQGMPVPPAFQAALFQKILHYDKAIASQEGQPTVLIVHEGALSAEESAVAEALRATGLVVVTCTPDELETKLQRAAAVYVVRPALAHVLARGCEKHRVLSLTGLPQLVVDGSVSVGIDKKSDGRPEIVVNRGRLAREGHELAAQLLGLARVID